MIEQLTKIIAAVMLKKKSGQIEEALRESNNSFNTLLGVNSKLFETLPYETVARMFGISEDPSTGSMKCIIAARLLKLKAELLSETNGKESVKLFHRSLLLYLAGILNMGYTGIDISPYFSDIAEIEKSLNGELTKEEAGMLSKFHKMLKK
jgi:hypothetical protein